MRTVPFKALHDGVLVIVGENTMDDNGVVVSSTVFDTKIARELGFVPGTVALRHEEG